MADDSENALLPGDDKPRIRILRDLFRVVVEAHPGRRHHVGVDVVEQLVGREVAHRQRERAGELLPDLLGVLRQIKDALARGERETAGRHGRTVPLKEGLGPRASGLRRSSER